MLNRIESELSETARERLSSLLGASQKGRLLIIVDYVIRGSFPAQTQWDIISYRTQNISWEKLEQSCKVGLQSKYMLNILQELRKWPLMVGINPLGVKTESPLSKVNKLGLWIYGRRKEDIDARLLQPVSRSKPKRRSVSS